MRSVNPFYSRNEVLAALRKAFRKNGSVAIGKVLFPTKIPTTGWERTTIPDQHNYARHEVIKLQNELRNLAHDITGQIPLREENRRFTKGDYTILHDQEVQSPGIIALLFIEDWDERWGGQIVFTKNGKTLERFTPQQNTLLIVRRNKGARYFVKYVNHKAGRRKLTIISA